VIRSLDREGKTASGSFHRLDRYADRVRVVSLSRPSVAGGGSLSVG
jgi:hypothetical protein